MAFSKNKYIFTITLSFFTLQFLLRVIPGIFSENITKYFSMSATQFGFFSSIYYLGYAGMQIPIGILLDKFKINIVVSTLILLCALSSIGLSQADNWITASFFRFIIGSSSVIGYIGCVKVAKEIFDSKLYNRIISITFSIGFIGAAICFVLSYILKFNNSEDWKFLLSSLSIILTVISFLSYFYLKPLNKSKQKSISLDIENIVFNKKIILTGISGGLMVGIFEGFADIWGSNFLKTAYNISNFDALMAASLIYFGIGVGAPIITYLADRRNNHIFITICTAIIISILFTIVIIVKVNYNYLLILCFIIGILSSNQVLIFSINTAKSDDKNIALTSAITNSFVMGFGIFFHITIGLLMDYFWNGVVVDGKRIYNIINYQKALMIIPISCIMGSFILWLVHKKEKLNI